MFPNINYNYWRFLPYAQIMQICIVNVLFFLHIDEQYGMVYLIKAG